jgi:hypothetical protein
MRPKIQKRSALDFDGRIIPPPLGGRGKLRRACFQPVSLYHVWLFTMQCRIRQCAAESGRVRVRKEFFLILKDYWCDLNWNSPEFPDAKY